MELFGINPDGGISLASGAAPTPRQVDNILRACSTMVAQFAYESALKKGLTPAPAAKPEKAAGKPLKERKDAFYTQLQKWRAEHSTKYPFGLYDEFFKHWTETNAKGVMRFEEQPFFEIGKRLATFWGFVKPNRRNEMIQAHDRKFPPPLKLL